MAKKPPDDPDEGVRRFLSDFRSTTDRRSFDERRDRDRRSSGEDVGSERRAKEGRRDSFDRRETLLDRRRGTPEGFIREHIGLICESLSKADADVSCPRCEGDLLLGPPVQHGDKFVREVHCTACRHSAVIEVPSETGESGKE